MRFFYLILFITASSTLFAQEEVEINIGDSLYFADCDSGQYDYIDLYVKTRFEKDSISYDTLNGWAFYNRFFNTGDFDVSRLPCRYEGSYGVIKHMMSVKNNEDQWVNVVIVMIKDGKSVGYIVEEAFIREEVIYAPKKNTSD